MECAKPSPTLSAWPQVVHLTQYFVESADQVFSDKVPLFSLSPFWVHEK